jgi:hypothetical protein
MDRQHLLQGGAIPGGGSRDIGCRRLQATRGPDGRGLRGVARPGPLGGRRLPPGPAGISEGNVNVRAQG